jgi:hypothetical protein
MAEAVGTPYLKYLMKSLNGLGCESACLMGMRCVSP